MVPELFLELMPLKWFRLQNSRNNEQSGGRWNAPAE